MAEGAFLSPAQVPGIREYFQNPCVGCLVLVLKLRLAPRDYCSLPVSGLVCSSFLCLCSSDTVHAAILLVQEPKLCVL